MDHGTIGLLMAVVPLLMGGIAPISGALSDKYGSRILTTIGLVVLVIAYKRQYTGHRNDPAWLHSQVYSVWDWNWLVPITE